MRVGRLTEVYSLIGATDGAGTTWQLAASRRWSDDFSPRQMKVFGTLKTIGAAGLVLPAAVVPVLVP